MQNIFFFFDDSGTLHISNDVSKFVYAGYVFTSRKDIDSARVRYTNLVKQIQKALKTSRELKACRLRPKYKRALYNVLRRENSLALVVDIARTYDKILYSSHSVCRYKDYILKIVIQAEIDRLIEKNILNPHDDISVFIYIDAEIDRLIEKNILNPHDDISVFIYIDKPDKLLRFDVLKIYTLNCVQSPKYGILMIYRKKETQHLEKVSRTSNMKNCVEGYWQAL